MGVRLRRLREERGMTQVALANALGLSPSYLSQIEQNQRPITVSVLLKINSALGLDGQIFANDDEARLLAQLREALAHEAAPDTVSVAEMRELASSMPAVARTLVNMHTRQRQTMQKLEAMSVRLGDDRAGVTTTPMPYEEVRDFFNTRHNHIAELDDIAERMATEYSIEPGNAKSAIEHLLRDRHGVRIARSPIEEATPPRRTFDAETRVLQISRHLAPGQAAFQMATQLGFLELLPLLQRLSSTERELSSETSRSLARTGLANYFAGALILPYTMFLNAAESLRYDIDRLGQRFGVGYETICHRLSTLQRPRARGVPFFFIRVDRAGNISKRQSASQFHFSKVGGTCPLWNIYEAFAQPGRILTQIARMPDGLAYLWIARTVSGEGSGYGTPNKTFAIGLGCDLQHAERLVYSKGLDLRNPEAATPIGMGCKVCEREACAQRAFPFVGRALAVDGDRRSSTPYAPALDIAPRGHVRRL